MNVVIPREDISIKVSYMNGELYEVVPFLKLLVCTLN